jgi:catechol 2,3-dioxygenase-like lactoylglutathione lyase family enzyme
MTLRRPDRSRTARVVELAVADEPSAWTDAGFALVDGVVRFGATAVRPVGSAGGRRGIVGWTLAGVLANGGADVDGLPTTFVPDVPDDDAVPATGHPNGATGLDHVVVFTPDLDRTIAAFTALQLPCLRIRDTGTAASPMQQAFFRCGPLILEVVGPRPGSEQPTDDGPASWFGLAVDVDDLEHSAERLGTALGRIKPAVQRGRRIATLRHRDLDVSIAVAFMDDHADRDASQNPSNPTEETP